MNLKLNRERIKYEEIVFESDLDVTLTIMSSNIIHFVIRKLDVHHLICGW